MIISISEERAAKDKTSCVETSCMSKCEVTTGTNKGEMIKPSIPEKPKHIDFIRRFGTKKRQNILMRGLKHIKNWKMFKKDQGKAFQE